MAWPAFLLLRGRVDTARSHSMWGRQLSPRGGRQHRTHPPRGGRTPRGREASVWGARPSRAAANCGDPEPAAPSAVRLGCPVCEVGSMSTLLAGQGWVDAKMEGGDAWAPGFTEPAGSELRLLHALRPPWSRSV